MKVVRMNGNIFNALFMMAFALFFILVTPSQVPLYEGSDALSPRLVPYTVLGLIGFLGLALLVGEFRKRTVVYRLKHTEEHNDKVIVNNEKKMSIKDLLIFISLSLFLVLTAEYIGFTFAAMIVLIVALKSFKATNLWLIIIVGVGVPIFIDVLFRFLEIYLPLGFWEGIIY